MSLGSVALTGPKHGLVALLGTNGAGKSTMLKGICGLVKPSAGKVLFAGEDVTNLTADATSHRGVSLMPGGKGVFPTLSVTENLRLAAWMIRDDQSRVEAAKAAVQSLFPILERRASHIAGDPSAGAQQMMARVAARLTRPTRGTRRNHPRVTAPKRCRRPPLFGLAPGGVYPATPVARGAVRSYRAVSPLPATPLRVGRRRFVFCGTFPEVALAGR